MRWPPQNDVAIYGRSRDYEPRSFASIYQHWFGYWHQWLRHGGYGGTVSVSHAVLVGHPPCLRPAAFNASLRRFGGSRPQPRHGHSPGPQRLPLVRHLGGPLAL